MPTDAQRRNLASAHHVEVQALKDKVAELEKQLENAFSAINYWKEEAVQAQSSNRCTNCDDTGDVHSIDGEWRGVCHCPAGQAIKSQSVRQEYVGVFRSDDDIGHVDLCPHQQRKLKDGDKLYASTQPQPAQRLPKHKESNHD